MEPIRIRKCPTCSAEFRDWESQYEHARAALHLAANSCNAHHIQTGIQCDKDGDHQGEHAYLGSAKLITWGKAK